MLSSLSKLRRYRSGSHRWARRSRAQAVQDPPNHSPGWTRTLWTGISDSSRRRRERRQQRVLCPPTVVRRWNSTSAMPKAASDAAAGVAPPAEPSFQTLRLVALGQAIPFIGFGFMDNAILIIAGDAIDTSLGVLLGISTMCAAAIGNIISDLAGIMLGTAIEDFCANTLRLPTPNLTTAQRALRSVRFASQGGMAVGMIVGCVLGMFPLLFIDTKKIEMLKKQAHLESLFRDVVTEAKSLVGAESTCLYLRVEGEHQHDKGAHHSHGSSNFIPNVSYRPSVDGDHLYAMYYVLPDRKQNKKQQQSSSSSTSSSSSYDFSEDSSRCLPLGKGIVSRAVMTGEAWNISNVHDEPDFFPEMEMGLPSSNATRNKLHTNEHTANRLVGDNFKDMVVVPVLDGRGRAIAVIRAMNKISTRGVGNDENGGGFTNQDVEVLKSLASHIAVSLQSVFKDDDDDAMRLRDTIRILKTHRKEEELREQRNPSVKRTPTGELGLILGMEQYAPAKPSVTKQREALFPE